MDDGELARAERFERVARLLSLGNTAALLVALALYAWRGHRFMRESAAGRIGTGMLLGMLGLAIVWLSQLPFAVAQHWWYRRYDLVELGYVEALLEGWLALAGGFLFICLALLIVMALAGRLERRWWLAAAPAFTGLVVAFAFLLPYLSAGTSDPLDDPVLAERARAFSRELGTESIPVRVESVSEYTSLPNAWAGGLGPSRRVFLWDTLLDGRFAEDEVAVVLAHELAHHAHDHIWQAVGWFALFSLPGTFLIAAFTRRRGGMGRPEAVPVGLLVLVVLQTLALPLDNALSRRHEAEADWTALEVARRPAAQEALFAGFTEEALADPTPPAWSYAFFESHPSVQDRIAMARAWAERNRRE